jgi:hypothetical protein
MLLKAETGRFLSRPGRRNPDGRNPYGITGTHLILSTDAATVHAHFPAPQDAIDVAFGDTLQVSRQKIVDSLPGLVSRYLNLTYLGETFRG